MISHAAAITRAYGISILVTCVGTAVSVMVTTMFAYPMPRKDFKYHNVLAFIAFFTMLFSGGIVPAYMMWTRFFSHRGYYRCADNTYSPNVYRTVRTGSMRRCFERN